MHLEKPTKSKLGYFVNIHKPVGLATDITLMIFIIQAYIYAHINFQFVFVFCVPDLIKPNTTRGWVKQGPFCFVPNT